MLGATPRGFQSPYRAAFDSARALGYNLRVWLDLPSQKGRLDHLTSSPSSREGLFLPEAYPLVSINQPRWLVALCQARVPKTTRRVTHRSKACNDANFGH